jgi:hypothetical protein
MNSQMETIQEFLSKRKVEMENLTRLLKSETDLGKEVVMIELKKAGDSIERLVHLLELELKYHEIDRVMFEDSQKEYCKEKRTLRRELCSKREMKRFILQMFGILAVPTVLFLVLGIIVAIKKGV